MKRTFSKPYQNEINTVNQLQLTYSTNIHLLIPWFTCVTTIKLNTLTDVPYKVTVGGAFVYVCERDRVKYFVYVTRSVITRFFPVDPDDRVIMELQCIYIYISMVSSNIILSKTLVLLTDSNAYDILH